MEIIQKHWKDLGIKDKIQYIMAIVLILAGIAMAFISFFIISVIEAGVLIFISQCFITAGGIFGVSIYFNSKIGQFSSKITNDLKDAIVKEIDKRVDDDIKIREDSKEG